jgi:serine/threonine protein kinase
MIFSPIFRRENMRVLFATALLLICPGLLPLSAAGASRVIARCHPSNPLLDEEEIVIVRMEELGKGGIGQVWAATTKTGQVYAIKESPDGIQYAAVERLLKPVYSSRSGARFNQIMKPLQDCVLYDSKFRKVALKKVVFTEKLDGSLDDIRSQFRLNPVEDSRNPVALERKVALLEKLMSQGGEALEALNRHGLVHGDVKPGNIFLRLIAGKDAKAVLSSEDVDFVFGDLDSVSRAGAEVRQYTVIYAAPEVLQAEAKPNGRSFMQMKQDQDLYSFATTLHNLVRGCDSPQQQGEPCPNQTAKRSSPKQVEQSKREFLQYFSGFEDLKSKSPGLYARVERIRDAIEAGTSWEPKERRSMFRYFPEGVLAGSVRAGHCTEDFGSLVRKGWGSSPSVP